MSHTRRGGRLVADQLLAHGLDTAFGVADVLHAETPGLRLVACRTETGAAHMAEAYGRLTGRPGVCLVARAAGAAQAAVGVHAASHASTPLLLLVEQVPRGHREREAFQELDHVAFFRPLAKWAAEVHDATRIPEYVARACHVAMSGRPGPVVLALPHDLLSETADVADAGPFQVVRPDPGPAALARLREAVAAAERPLVVAGGGGWSARTAVDVQALCERWRLPVAAAFRCDDYVDNRSPAYCGTLGPHADAALAARVRDADVLLVIGARLDDPTTAGYRLVRAPRPRQALIHVHADPAELGRVFAPTLALNAGSAEFARAALALPAPDPARWAAWTRAARAEYQAAAGPADAGRWSAVLRERLPDDTVLVGDHAPRHWRFTSFGTHVGAAAGATVPAAIAAKLARPERTVLAVSDAAGFVRGGLELATAVRHGAAVVFLVADALAGPDVAAYASAFGVRAETAESPEAMAAAVVRAAGAGTPTVVRVPAGPDLPAPDAPVLQASA